MYDPKLVKLTEPFPKAFVKDDGRGNDYIPHHIINQRLIQVFGRPPRIEILREVYDGEKLTGVVMRMTVPGFDSVDEGGEADNPQSKTNGARLKDACSDALKRCAMRLGCGLHLWAQDNYYLHDKILKAIAGEPDAAVKPEVEESPGWDAPSSPPSDPSAAQTQAGESVVTGPPSDSPDSPDALLARYTWEQIKGVAKDVAMRHPGSNVPLKVERLADCDPAVIQDIAAELETRMAV